MASTGVTWETLTSSNIAADFAFLNSRLSATAEYYWKENQNMLSPLTPGNIIGAENLPRENVGTLKIWGWELSVGWRDKIGDLKYNVSFNIYDDQNELIDYKGVDAVSAGTVAQLAGYPLNTLWGYQTAGFWKSRQEYLDYQAANPGYKSWEDAKVAGGDTRYVSQGTADHTIGIGGGTPDDPGDLIYLGDAGAHYNYGVNIGLEWKGFDFSCFLQGVGKRSFFVNNSTLAPLSTSSEMPWTIHKDYWTEDNQDAYFARLFGNSTGNYQYADRWVQNGSYIRLKNISLGYTIPLKKFIESARVYVTGTDLWESTKTFNVFDPEIANRVETATSSSINDRVGRGNYYPFFRTLTVGVNITL
ncbi:hypothetical protein AGMMS49965_25590 [Bacteroidia bacterium]|nr:hypothetical protein AGMMS49965_25590 [Bacteroidia bacterium]